MGSAQGNPRSRTVSAATFAASLSAGGPAAATPVASATAAIVVTSRGTSPLGEWLGCIGDPPRSGPLSGTVSRGCVLSLGADYRRLCRPKSCHSTPSSLLFLSEFGDWHRMTRRCDVLDAIGLT